MDRGASCEVGSIGNMNVYICVFWYIIVCQLHGLVYFYALSLSRIIALNDLFIYIDK